MTLSSAGLLTIADDLIIKDVGTIGSASDPDSMTIAANGVVTFSQIPVLPDNTISQDMMQDDSVGSAEMKTLSTLLIKNASGSTLKTLHAAGA